jgi:hypothetical protein
MDNFDPPRSQNAAADSIGAQSAVDSDSDMNIYGSREPARRTSGTVSKTRWRYTSFDSETDSI